MDRRAFLAPVVDFDPHASCRREVREAMRHHERCQNVEQVIEERGDGTLIVKAVKRILQGPRGLRIVIAE